MSKTITRLVEKGRNKLLEEYLVFDDLQEYLKWYALDYNERYYAHEKNQDTTHPFTRRGYENWKSIKINDEYYYSLYENDYEKVTRKVYKELLDFADKTYSIYIVDHKYYGNQGNCRFTGDCITKELAIEKSKGMAEDSIYYYQKEIDKLQEKIDYLKNLNHEALIKTQYEVTFPKLEGELK